LKRYLIFISAILVIVRNSTAQQVFKNNDLEINLIEERVWVVETTDKTTMYIIEGNNKAMLIDTGTKCDKLDEVVKQVTQKPLYVVITHVHPDHAGNMNYFDDVWFHPADTVLMNRAKPYQGRMHFVSDDQIFDLGDRQIQVVHTPAHTPGSVVLIDKKAGSCYSGDAFGSGQVWLQVKPVAPMKIYISSLKKMEKLMDEGITKIYCGHYPYVKKAYDKSYIADMLKVAEGLENGTISDAKEYPVRIPIGPEKPMIATVGQASIVYDQEHLR
jgi:glyoxylase-like metal-dependent hydrolase (beta-lactamase superfamily II)